MTLGIGQTAGIKDLQEEIKHFWMGLLKFIKQDDTMWATTKLAR